MGQLHFIDAAAFFAVTKKERIVLVFVLAEGTGVFGGADDEYGALRGEAVSGGASLF